MYTYLYFDTFQIGRTAAEFRLLVVCVTAVRRLFLNEFHYFFGTLPVIL